MSKAVRVLILALPLAVAAVTATRKPSVVGTFSISPYGLV